LAFVLAFEAMIFSQLQLNSPNLIGNSIRIVYSKMFDYIICRSWSNLSFYQTANNKTI